VCLRRPGTASIIHDLGRSFSLRRPRFETDGRTESAKASTVAVPMASINVRAHIFGSSKNVFAINDEWSRPFR